MSAGVISTARLTHATPAASYANTPERNWESDSHTNEAGVECDDIAKQLASNTENHRFKVN